MTGSDDFAKYMVPREPEYGYRQGVIVDWDSLTGANVVNVGGTNIENLDVLATSDSIMLAPGDRVLLLKFQSTLCILGRIAPAGTGSIGIRAAANAASGFTASTSYTDLSSGVGPSLANVSISSSRRCMVIVSAAIYAEVDDDGAAHFTVSGASTIAAPTGSSAFSEGAFLGTFSGGGAIEGSATRTFILTEANGLNAGLNTFTMKYLSRNGGDAQFSDRVITVFPF